MPVFGIVISSFDRFAESASDKFVPLATRATAAEASSAPSISVNDIEGRKEGKLKTN